MRTKTCCWTLFTLFTLFTLLALVLCSGPAVLAQQRGAEVNVTTAGALCNGVANDGPAIEAAIASGARRVVLPAGCRWIPRNNTLPAGPLWVVGGGESTTIESADPKTEWLSVPHGVVLENLALRDRFGWDNFGVDKSRYTVFYANTSGRAQIPGIWPGTFANIDLGERPGFGTASTDNPGIQITNYGGGDNFFAQCAGPTGCRPLNMEIRSPAKDGQAALLTFWPGIDGYTGFDCRDRTITSPSVRCFYAEVSAKVVSTPILHFVHRASDWGGEGILLDFAEGSGNFTGSFLQARRAGDVQFDLDRAGNIGVGTFAQSERVLSARRDGAAGVQLWSSPGRAVGLISTAGGSLDIQDDSGQSPLVLRLDFATNKVSLFGAEMHFAGNVILAGDLYRPGDPLGLLAKLAILQSRVDQLTRDLQALRGR